MKKIRNPKNYDNFLGNIAASNIAAVPDSVGSEAFCPIEVGSGSGRPGSVMKIKENFAEKIHNFSTKCTIQI
jgi:hypothetical protein